MSEDPPADQALPPVYELPLPAVERWATVPDDALLALSLTKGELDELMMGLRRITISQLALGDAFAAFTRQDMEGANDRFKLHQLNARDGYSNINRFIETVMTKSADGEAHNG